MVPEVFLGFRDPGAVFAEELFLYYIFPHLSVILSLRYVFAE